jgi:hypothetical protein
MLMKVSPRFYSYVRSDMNDTVSAAMAKLQQPQIILHNSGQDGTYSIA